MVNVNVLPISLQTPDHEVHLSRMKLFVALFSTFLVTEIEGHSSRRYKARRIRRREKLFLTLKGYATVLSPQANTAVRSFDCLYILNSSGKFFCDH